MTFSLEPYVQIQNNFTELILIKPLTKIAQMVSLRSTKGPPELQNFFFLNSATGAKNPPYKNKISFFQNMAMLHIKLKHLTITYWQIFYSYTYTQNVDLFSFLKVVMLHNQIN